MAYGAQAEAAHDDHPHGWRRVYSTNHKAAVSTSFGFENRRAKPKSYPLLGEPVTSTRHDGNSTSGL